MQTELGSQTWPEAFGVAWQADSGVKSKVVWENEWIIHIFHSLWKADKQRKRDDGSEGI